MKRKQRVPQKVKPPASKSESEQNISLLNSSSQKNQGNSRKFSVSEGGVTEKKNQELKKYQMEVTKLKMQHKHGTLTPQGQKQLALLQAKINDLQGKIADDNSSEAKVTGDKNNSSSEQVIQGKQLEDNDKANFDKKDKQSQEKAAQIKQKQFLEKYPVAEKLVAGIDKESNQSNILKQLLENFKDIGFTYNSKNKSYGLNDRDKSYENLLKGDLEGDCYTLARAFKAVAEEYFDIKDVKVNDDQSSIRQGFTTDGDQIIDSSVEPNCDRAQKWFFQNHYWVVWNGEVFDTLFLREQEPKADMVKQNQSLESSLMPEQQYYETEMGKIVYPSKGKYLTAELQTFEKLTEFIKNISRNAPDELDNIVTQVKSLYAKGGDINSDFERLMQDFKKQRVNKASFKKKNNSIS